MSRILLVDDHEPVRQTLKTMIQDMGHVVLTAANGRQALTLHQQTPADVVLTDIFMPEMDGYELIQKFRRDFPQVKVIAMSGGIQRVPDGPFLDVASKMGAHGLLHKPFSAARLSAVLSEATGGATASG